LDFRPYNKYDKDTSCVELIYKKENNIEMKHDAVINLAKHPDEENESGKL